MSIEKEEKKICAILNLPHKTMINVVNVRTELIHCGFAVILQFFLAKLNFWCNSIRDTSNNLEHAHVN